MPAPPPHVLFKLLNNKHMQLKLESLFCFYDKESTRWQQKI